MKAARLMMVAITLGIAPCMASAGDWRVGFAVGVSDYDSLLSEQDIVDSALAIEPGLTLSGTSSSIDLDSGDTAYKLFMDYDFSDYLGIDLGYVGLGDIEEGS